MDPALIGGIVAFAGFALWAVTNWHLSRGVRHVRTDIETKRVATEAFVAAQIGRIERSVADLRGAPPPPEVAEMQEEVGALRRELSDALGQMGVDMRAILGQLGDLPMALLRAQGGTAGTEQKAFQQALTKAEADVQTPISIQEAMLSQDPQALQYAMMRRIADAKVTDKYAEEHPIGAMLIEAGKAKLLETMQSGFGVPGRSVGPRRATKTIGGSSDI